MSATNICSTPFAVSVIIPVYNAEEFLEKAIGSVLAQDVVSEVLLINDGSTDGSLALLKEFRRKDCRVVILHHSDQLNKGRSASRNLGLLRASSDYIAFLDADDFYLGNRFEKDKFILQDESIDGTYNAVGFQLYRKTNCTENHHFKLATLSKAVVPELLFENIVASRLGYLHLNGITVKRSALKTIGLFNENLIVAEDSDFIFKLSLKLRLAAGLIEGVVAKRGVHYANIFTRDDIYKSYNLTLYETLITWSLQNNISLYNIELLLNTLWVLKFRQENNLFYNTIYWLRLQFKWPRLFFTNLSIKFFPIVRLRKNLLTNFFK